MKILHVLSLLFALASLALAQPATRPLPAAPASEARVTERGPHHRVWTRLVAEPTPDGGTRQVERRSVELTSGLHYPGPWGDWIESREGIESYPGGSVARQGPLKTIFARNLATAGAIDMQLPDGQRLRSHLLGLSYFDTASGQSVLIAEVQDSVGVVDGNQVFYEDAFAGVHATVRYTATRGGFEQDILLLERPPLPERFGLDSRTTVLQVLTEFLDPPAVTLRPERATRADGVEVTGDEVDFGTFRMGRGQAFRWDGGRRSGDLPVRKTWRQLDGRDFLIEEVPVPDIADELDRLPPRTGATPAGTNGVPRTASLRLALPPAPRTARLDHADAPPMLLARVTPPDRAFVLDYQGNIGTNNYTFQADTTYYVSGRLNLYGTTTFEGGAVIKYTNQMGADLWVHGPMLWDTGPYRPVVFTGRDDDSVGETLPGSTGNPQRQQHVALVTAQAGTVRGARFLFARTALCPLASLVVEDAQWVDCGNAIDAYGQPVTVRNALFTQVDTLVEGSITDLTVTGEHWTADRFGSLVNLKAGVTLTNLNLTNCLFTAGTNWVTGQANPTIRTNAVTWLAGNAGIYQTAGGGRYYLADASPYRNTGATNVSTNTLALLRARTTHPPLVFSNVTFTADTTFTPQAQRDTDTPDRGYHYPPLDYVLGGCHTTTNLNLTVTAGTALGWFRTSAGWYHAGQGLHLGDRSVLTFAGTATAPTWWVRFNTAQEGGVSTWAGGYGPGGITSWAWPALADAPRVTARFLRCAALASDALHLRDDWGWLIAELRDCEFYSGGVAGYNSRLQLTNCLLYRASVWVSHGRTDGDLALRNCTLHGGEFVIDRRLDPNDPPLGQAKVSVRDCAFDRTLVSTADVMANNPTYTDYGWNAYRTNTTQTTPTGANNVLVTNFNWQAGALGHFYLPTISALLDAGSLTNAALAGLYQHTTQTNQTKEANTRLDLAYHYIACAANGLPVDTDGDGVPDYLEDANGNGVVDSAETHWNDAADLGLKVLILRPRAGSLGP